MTAKLLLLLGMCCWFGCRVLSVRVGWFLYVKWLELLMWFRHIFYVLRGATLKDDKYLIVPYMYGGRYYIHHIPYGDYGRHRVTLPVDLAYYDEHHNTPPIAVVPKDVLDAVIENHTDLD